MQEVVRLIINLYILSKTCRFMFDSLKKKISGWFKKTEEKPKKKKKAAKAPKKEPTDEELKEQVKKIKEELPMKFEVGEQKYEPDIDKIKEAQEIVEEVSPKIEKREPETHEDDEEEDLEDKIQESEAEEKGGFFSKIVKKLTTSELKQDQFDEYFEDLELSLLENNVSLEAVDQIKLELSKDLVGISIKKDKVQGAVLDSLKESILSLLIESPNLEKQIGEKKKDPYVILFFGINGSGKTTSIAKLAFVLKAAGFSVVLGAGDTFRAASIEQLQIHGDKVGVKVISQKYGADPAAVAFDTISYAKKNKIDVVLIDTAGRMYTKSDLLREMEKIVRVSKPDLKMFVGESITGNDATEQAKKFNETIGIDGIILSKADIDKKAGAILSVSQATKKPIYYLGTGQDYTDLKKFTKKTVLKNIGIED